VGELAVTAVLVFVYDQVRRHAAPRSGSALDHGRDVLNAERHLGLDWEGPFNSALSRHHVLAEFASWWYQLAHLSVTLSVLACCYIVWPAGYRTARNALVLTNLVGLLVFFLCPVAPPRLLPGTSYIDTIAETLGTGAWATWVTATVWAMVGARGLPPWIRAVAVVYPLITSYVVVATANHYVLDVVAGSTVAAFALVVAPQITLRRTSTASRQPAGTRGSQTVTSR